MAPSQGGNEIMWRFSAGGPTGESDRYVTVDGRVWKPHYGTQAAVTGVTYGQHCGGEIYQR